MSLNKTLDRLFDEIRREAKRNPEFADRLDAVLRLHESRRDVADEVIEDVAMPPSAANGAAPPAVAKPRRNRPGAVAPQPQQPPSPAAPSVAPGINPAGLYKREGEDALRTALAAQDLGALRALVVEHNLDPSGVTPSLTRDELAEHILAQARRRAERDDKMFDY
jgi:hypothetical protein